MIWAIELGVEFPLSVPVSSQPLVALTYNVLEWLNIVYKSTLSTNCMILPFFGELYVFQSGYD